MRYLLPLLLILAGCGYNPPPLATPDVMVATTTADRAAIHPAALAVFAEMGVPIALHDPAAGLITGAEQTISARWDNVPVRDRMYCGKTIQGDVQFADYPVRFTMGLHSSPNQQGSTVRLVFNGTAQVPPRMGTPESCRLTAAFAREVIERIIARAEGR